jgi:hypothetical protein
MGDLDVGASRRLFAGRGCWHGWARVGTVAPPGAWHGLASRRVLASACALPAGGAPRTLPPQMVSQIGRRSTTCTAWASGTWLRCGAACATARWQSSSCHPARRPFGRVTGPLAGRRSVLPRLAPDRAALRASRVPASAGGKRASPDLVPALVVGARARRLSSWGPSWRTATRTLRGRFCTGGACQTAKLRRTGRCSGRRADRPVGLGWASHGPPPLNGYAFGERPLLVGIAS